MKRENSKIQNTVSRARAAFQSKGTKLNLRLALALPLFFLACCSYSLFYHLLQLPNMYLCCLLSSLLAMTPPCVAFLEKRKYMLLTS
jgi:hypothetical protein